MSKEVIDELTCSHLHRSPAPPISPEDSPPPLQSLPSQLTCSWLHTYDTESTIASQTISIATDNLDQSHLFSFALPGNMTNFTSPVMNFSSDQAYYVTLYYTNGAGLENIITSRPVYYDLTPPISPSVVRGRVARQAELCIRCVRGAE